MSDTWNFITAGTNLVEDNNANDNPDCKLYVLPNPISSITKIQLIVNKNLFAELSIFDNNGKEIAKLCNKELSPGQFTYDWDATNFSNGVYYCRLLAEGKIITKKIILEK